MSRPVVVKVGGSLLGWPELPGRLGAYLAARRQARLVLVAGGGPAADLVRDLDRAHGLGEPQAHALALRSLDLTARLLACLVEGLAVVESLGALEPAWTSGRVPVAAPRPILDEIEPCAAEPLPHTWDVTSDSIAARIAAHLNAEALVLLKSARLPPETDRRRAARLGLVDNHFVRAARPIERVEYLCLRELVAQAQPLPA